MIIPDVNVLVHAWRKESDDHDVARTWLEDAVSAGEPLGIPAVVATGVIQVLTLRVPGLAMAIGDVIDRVTELRSATGVVIASPGTHHWGIFADLCRTTGATGNLVPDCYLAALALEHDATLCSRDQFFGRIPGMRWTEPF